MIIPNNHVEESDMQSNESTHYIYANVSSWSYACDQLSSNEAGCEPTLSLHLETITEQCDILQEPMPLGLCIVHDSKDFNWKPPVLPWELDLIHAQEDPPIPRCLEAVITMAEMPFRDIKESLFLTAKSTAASVQVKLAIQEKITAQPDGISERSFAIVGFGYTLNHQKENK